MVPLFLLPEGKMGLCHDAGAQLQVSTGEDGKERGMKFEVSVGARKAVGLTVGDVVNKCVFCGDEMYLSSCIVSGECSVWGHV